jgi:GTPase SAR1 family protein
MPKTLKLVIVGDGAAGKTCMAYVYSKNEFPEDYTPTVVDNFTLTVSGSKKNKKIKKKLTMKIV